MSVRVARALLVVALVLLPLPARAQQPDWTSIEYRAGAGCGLHVQFFMADGAEPSVNGKPTAFFAGGAPPSTSASECLARCGQWAGSSMVRTLAAVYRTSASLTQVRGTCYLRKNALGAPRVIDVP